MWISYSMFFENRMCLEIYTSKQNMKDFMEAEVKKLLTTEKSIAEMLEHYGFRHSELNEPASLFCVIVGKVLEYIG